MIKSVRHQFEDFSVVQDSECFLLELKSDNYNYAQRKLFMVMLNSGAIKFETGDFKISSRDIMNFWFYAKDSFLSDYSVEEYLKLCGLSELYKDKIPSIKTQGSFFSPDYEMKIGWEKDSSSVVTSAVVYLQKGFELIDQKYDTTLGSMYPEYLELYYLIDDANVSWKDWGNSQKYDFLKRLQNQNVKRKIIIPKNLQELLMHNNEMEGE